jgi:hypothetical protein
MLHVGGGHPPVAGFCVQEVNVKANSLSDLGCVPCVFVRSFYLYFSITS